MTNKVMYLPVVSEVSSHGLLYSRFEVGISGLRSHLRSRYKNVLQNYSKHMRSPHYIVRAPSVPLFEGCAGSGIPNFEQLLGPIWPNIMACVWLQYDLYTADSVRSFAIAIARFLTTNCPLESIKAFCEYIGGSVTTSFIGLFETLQSIFQSEVPTFSACSSGVDIAKSLLSAIKILPNSEIVNTSSKVMMGILAMPVVQSLGLDFSATGLIEFQKHNLKKFVFSSTMDMVKSVLEMYISVAEIGHQCWAEKSLRPILRANDKVTKWTEEVGKFEVLLASRYSDTGFDTNSALSQLADLILQGECISMDTEHKYFMKEQLQALRKKQVDLRMKANVSAYRNPPYSLLICGQPGIGKSTLIKLLATFYHQVVTSQGIYEWLPWDPDKHIYTRNPGEEHWNGYKGAAQFVIILDDLALEHSKHIAMGKVDSIGEIIRVCNTIGMASNQASLEDKGVIPICPKLVLGSTNVPNLNASQAVADPSAVYRRFDLYITPHLRPEFTDPDTGTFKDTGKPVRDAWTFTIQRHRIVTTGPNEWKSVFETLCPPENEGWDTSDPAKYTWQPHQLFKFLFDRIVAHEMRTKRMNEANKLGPETELCLKCKAFKYCCHCKSEFKAVSEPSTSLLSRSFDFVQQHVVDRAQRVSSSIVETARGIRDESIVLCFSSLVRTVGIEETVRMVAQVYFYGTDEVRERLVKKLKAHGNDVVLKVIEGANELRKPKTFQERSSILLKVAGGGALLMALVGIYQQMSKGVEDPKPEEPLLSEKIMEGTGGIWASTKECVLPKEKAVNDDCTQLINTVSKSMIYVTVENVMPNGKPWQSSQSGFSLGDGNFCTAAHLFDSRAVQYLVEVRYAPDSQLSPALLFRVTPSQVTRFDDEDFVIVKSLNNIPRKNILPFFSQFEYQKKGKVKIVKRDPEGNLVVQDGHVTKYGAVDYRVREGRILRLPNVAFFEKRDENGNKVPTKHGECGSLVLIETPVGWKIHSMIVAGEYENEGASIMLCARHFMDRQVLCAYESDSPKFMEGTSSSGPLMTQHPEHNMATWSGGGFGEVIGRFKTRIQGKSRVCYTLHGEELEKLLPLTEKYTAPMMRVTCKDGKWLNCWALSMQHQINPSKGFNEEMLRFCMYAYKCDVSRALGDKIKDIRPYSILEAINGVKGDAYVNRLPMNTSGGMRYPGGKQRWLTLDDEGYYHPGPELLHEIHEAEEAYLDCRQHGFMMNGCLKDEPVTQAKAESGKTRVFTMMDMSGIILERTQFLGVAKVFMENNFASECMVGMNCYSDDAERLYNYITRDGKVLDQTIAGDFSKFDKRLNSVILKTAFDCMTALCRESGNFTTQDFLIQRGIATELSYPVTNYNGDVYRMFGGNSSGHSMTVQVNSVANSILMRYAFWVTTGKDPSEFQKFVRLATLGDDNIMSSTNPAFNHTEISKTLAQYGIGYTMADKGAESRPFINISEADFLKRSFRELNGRIVMPIDPQSVYKSLVVMTDEQKCTKSKQAADAYLSGRREMSLHGKEAFDSFVAVVDPILKGDPDVANEMIDQHYWDWERTFEWVCTTKESADGDIEEEEEVDIPMFEGCSLVNTSVNTVAFRMGYHSHFSTLVKVKQCIRVFIQVLVLMVCIRIARWVLGSSAPKEELHVLAGPVWSYEDGSVCGRTECFEGVYPFCYLSTTTQDNLSPVDVYNSAPAESVLEQSCNLYPKVNMFEFMPFASALRFAGWAYPLLGMLWLWTGSRTADYWMLYCMYRLQVCLVLALRLGKFLYWTYPRVLIGYEHVDQGTYWLYLGCSLLVAIGLILDLAILVLIFENLFICSKWELGI